MSELLQIPLQAIATGVNAKVIAHNGGSYFFSIQGDFDGNTAQLVLTQDTPANFAPANNTQLTSNGGFPVNIPDKHMLALDLGGGGASPDVTFTMDRIKSFVREVAE